jgi:magnesium chelatase subunit D
VLEAARARLPQEFELAVLAPSAGRAGRRGALIRQLRDGHRVGARPGDPRREGRIDLSATLRAAAPWQPARREAQPERAARILVRPGDLHVQVRARHSATATVFLVDASGSQALNRLAEVKGAVELLLADSYVRREEVALVTFRGRDAEVILPPTRSLVRARRALAGLPGGGGTPLARGLLEGLSVARRLRAAEAVPRVVLLSDGRPNVDREGQGGRAAARKDALAAAALLAAEAIPLLVLDTSVRGEAFAAELASAGGGRHLHLPRADARTVRAAIGTLDSRS